MKPAVLGLVASLAVLAAAAPLRPPGHRRVPGEATGPGPHPLSRLGARVRPWARVGGSPLPDALLGALVPVASLLLLVAPPVSVALVAGVWTHARIASHHARQARERAIAQGLPDTVDLLLLCLGAGLSLHLAHPLVAARSPSPLGDALRAADVAASRGRPRADALLDALVPLGERAASLAHTLADHLRYGTPLEPNLERANLELRLDRRRRAEEAARRVPVRLLAPLVTCVLPAFGLLTVVPLLAASLQSLPR